MRLRNQFLALSCLVATLGASSPVAYAADIPDDLKLVPGNAAGFVHVQLADLWKNDAMATYRSMFEKAGARAIQSLDAQFTPAPSTIDRFTAVLFLDPGKIRNSPEEGLSAALIVQFSARVDAARVRSIHLPGSMARTIAGKEYFVSKGHPSIAFVGDRIIVLGQEPEIRKVLAGSSDGPMSAVLQRASGKHVLAAVNVASIPIPPNALDAIPDDFKALARVAFVSLAVEVGKETSVDLRLNYGNETNAITAQKSLKKAADMGRVLLNQQRQNLEQQIFKPVANGSRPLEELPLASSLVAGLGLLNYADEILANPPLEREHADITIKAIMPTWTSQYLAISGVSLGLLLPAVQKVREAAARTQAMNNLKQIGLAFHNFHDAHGSLPPAAICDKKGRKLLSWRVAILPYIEQQALYNQFKLDEPWDSEHNKPLSNILIKVYTDPRAVAPPGYTYYKAFVGNGAVLDKVKGTRFQQITDGLSNTLLVVGGGDPVPWSKPDDIEFDPAKPLPILSKPFGGQLISLFGDGSVRTIQEANIRKDNDRILKLLIQMADGNPIPDFN